MRVHFKVGRAFIIIKKLLFQLILILLLLFIILFFTYLLYNIQQHSSHKVQNTRETAAAIRGMKLKRAKEFLQNVLDHKEAVAFRRFNGGVGRTAQAKAYNVCVPTFI